MQQLVTRIHSVCPICKAKLKAMFVKGRWRGLMEKHKEADHLLYLNNLRKSTDTRTAETT